MVERKEVLYQDTAMQLKAIREEMRKTLDVVSGETGISRSYLSDFERGFRLPTSKYLRYLHDHHRVNLNYVFGGEGRKFRAADEAGLDFGHLQDEVDKMLHFMAEMPHALFSMLSHFAEYKLVNKKLIEQHQAATTAKTGEPGE